MNVGDKGFTLIELLVALAVAVILATVAIPNFQGLIERSKISTSVNDVVKSLNMAKAEAVKNNENSTILVELGGLIIGPERFEVSLSSGMSLASTFEENTLEYRPNGWLVAGGKVCMYDDGEIVREIGISLSGLVSVSESDLAGCE